MFCIDFLVNQVVDGVCGREGSEWSIFLRKFWMKCVVKMGMAGLWGQKGPGYRALVNFVLVGEFG